MYIPMYLHIDVWMYQCMLYACIYECVCVDVCK